MFKNDTRGDKKQDFLSGLIFLSFILIFIVLNHQEQIRVLFSEEPLVSSDVLIDND